MTAITQLERQFRDAHLRFKPGEYRRAVKVFGPPKHVPAAKTLAARVAKKHHTPANGLEAPKSKTVAVGNPPEGFGKYIEWSDHDKELALLIYLNAADPTGVAVLNVKPTDTIELVFADGQASFKESDNSGLSGLIGIAAAGLEVTATAYGLPEVVPVIKET